MNGFDIIEPFWEPMLLYAGSHVTHEAKHFSYFHLGRQQVLHAHRQRCKSYALMHSVLPFSPQDDILARGEDHPCCVDSNRAMHRSHMLMGAALHSLLLYVLCKVPLLPRIWLAVRSEFDLPYGNDVQGRRPYCYSNPDRYKGPLMSNGRHSATSWRRSLLLETCAWSTLEHDQRLTILHGSIYLACMHELLVLDCFSCLVCLQEGHVAALERGHPFP